MTRQKAGHRGTTEEQAVPAVVDAVGARSMQMRAAPAMVRIRILARVPETKAPLAAETEMPAAETEMPTAATGVATAATGTEEAATAKAQAMTAPR